MPKKSTCDDDDVKIAHARLFKGEARIQRYSVAKEFKLCSREPKVLRRHKHQDELANVREKVIIMILVLKSNIDSDFECGY